MTNREFIETLEKAREVLQKGNHKAATLETNKLMNQLLVKNPAVYKQIINDSLSFILDEIWESIDEDYIDQDSK